jgi:hypothetical protein
MRFKFVLGSQIDVVGVVYLADGETVQTADLTRLFVGGAGWRMGSKMGLAAV